MGEQLDLTCIKIGVGRAFLSLAHFTGYFDYAFGFEFGEEIGQRLVFGIEHDLGLSLPIPEVEEEYAPVIVEVMAKSDVSSFDAFKAKVKASKIRLNGSVLEYKTIYGDRITLDTSFEKTPTINGKPIDYAPEKVFESPFLNADWNSGIVTISKGNRKKVLNFESGNSTQRN